MPSSYSVVVPLATPGVQLPPATPLPVVVAGGAERLLEPIAEGAERQAEQLGKRQRLVDLHADILPRPEAAAQAPGCSKKMSRDKALLGNPHVTKSSVRDHVNLVEAAAVDRAF